MHKRSFRFLFVILTFTALISFAKISSVQADSLHQQPTLSLPTVTSSPMGTIAEVNGDQDQINVRAGPGVDYPTVGILTARQRVPARGRSPGGDWVQIVYPGVPGGLAWVYAYLVRIEGELSIVEPPPTPTPRVTPTIDPTLAAQYVIEIGPQRLPTFTPPQPLVMPTFPVAAQGQGAGNLPVGFIIVGLAVVGLFGLMISLLRGR